MDPGTADPRGDAIRWWRENTRGRPRRAISLERRWFGAGVPAFVLATSENWEEQQERVDRYALVGRDDVGLKLRNGRRAGLKVRRCRVDLADGFAPAERWSRLSARTGASPPAEDPGWTPVVKQRRRRMVDLSPSDPVGYGPGLRRPVPGGSVEVVSLVLSAQGDQAWSVAVEAWGRSDAEGIRRVMAWSGIDWQAVEAWSEMTASYPGWLNTRLGRRGWGQ